MVKRMARERLKFMLDFWRQEEDSDRQTRVDGGLILDGDSECRKRMDDRRQKGLGVGDEVHAYRSL